MADASSGNRNRILVVGGGISGLTAAIEAAEAGCEVILIDKSAYVGGRVASFHQYFPKMCPPPCGLEINFRRIKNNSRVTVLTLAQLEKLSGSRGNYEATIKIAPRFVTEACTACGDCTKVCPVDLPDTFNNGITTTKAIHLPHRASFPAHFVIERSACPPDCHACLDVCKYRAVRLHEEEMRKTLQVSSIVFATGWAPYDAIKIENLGFGRYANVITNVMFERLAAVDGPTGGNIVRPSDNKPPKAVAFIQCAGSRDQNHLPYCSGVCCTASLKHASYIRAQYPDAKITMFYIDLRTPGHLENFAAKAIAANNIELIKGKVGRVQQHPASGDLLLTAEDILGRRKITREYDLVVLAVGMVPQTDGLPVSIDEFGFAVSGKPGIYPAGCVKRPSEVSTSIRDATGAALKAMQCGNGMTGHQSDSCPLCAEAPLSVEHAESQRGTTGVAHER